MRTSELSLTLLNRIFHSAAAFDVDKARQRGASLTEDKLEESVEIIETEGARGNKDLVA